MRVARISAVVLAVVAVAATVLPADADPMGGGGGRGGGGGVGLGIAGVGAAIGTAVVVGGIVSAMDDAARRRDEAVQSGLAAGRAAGKKEIPLEEFDRRMNKAYKILRKRPQNDRYSDSDLAGIALDKMNEKYTIAKPPKYDNDAILEQGREQNRELIRIKSRGGSPQAETEANDPNRLKNSGMNQQEHDLLYKPGTKATGTEW